MVSFVFLLILSTCGLHGHSVQLTLTLLCDIASALLVLLNEAHLFQLLEAVADDLPRSLEEEFLLGPSALLPTIDFAEAAHTGTTADVDLSHHGGGPDVEPVRVIWRQLLLLS